MTGVESWGIFGDPDNYQAALNFGPNTHIVGVGWNMTATTSGFSWLSEISIDIFNSNITGGAILNPGFSFPFGGTATFDSGDIISLVGNGDFLLNADGLLHMTVYESLDDNDNAVDATFLAGSMFIQYVIPAPGALAILGLGGLVVSGRKRQSQSHRLIQPEPRNPGWSGVF